MSKTGNTVRFENQYSLPYAIEEALSRLRVNISFLGSDVQVIMVESADPNEGKSFIAWNLWQQMAEVGERTLLIDADMRNSVLREKYGVVKTSGEEIRGTSHFLSKNIVKAGVVLKTDNSNADLIVNTENIDNPSMLLESAKFKSLIEEAREEYRYIFIDAPPLSLVSDGEKIGSLCDGAIMSVRSGVTQRRALRESAAQLSRAGCPILGVVLNRVSTSKNGYYSKYYRKEYGYYGYGRNEKPKAQKLKELLGDYLRKATAKQDD